VDEHWQGRTIAVMLRHTKAVTSARRAPGNADFVSIKTYLSVSRSYYLARSTARFVGATEFSLVIHAAHAAALGERRSFLLRMFGDRRLGGDDQTRDRRGVLEGVRTTLVGSIMPSATRSPYLPVCAS
jgi:hypothetical protein